MIFSKVLLQMEHCDDEESFFELLSRFQSERMDDQRCSLAVATDNKENHNMNKVPAHSQTLNKTPVHNNGNFIQYFFK